LTERRQCEFFLLRYVPDAVKDEFVNLGVVLYEPGKAGSGQAAFADVRFTRDWRRVRCLDPDVDVEMLEALEREIRERLAEGDNSREWLLSRMEDSFSNAIRLTPGKAVLAESPQAEMENLAQLYLERARRGGRTFSGRQVVFGRMRDEFERHGVWKFMRKGIAVAEYTHRGDPLKIDCGYAPQKNGTGGAPPRADGRVKLFHAISLEADVNSAKVLAFSFPHLRAGIQRIEQVRAELTAIVEDDLDRDDEGIGFALATLKAQDIAVASLADMPRIAERARMELRL
jgi:hypothetical protein